MDSIPVLIPIKISEFIFDNKSLFLFVKYCILKVEGFCSNGGGIGKSGSIISVSKSVISCIKLSIFLVLLLLLLISFDSDVVIVEFFLYLFSSKSFFLIM